ncbi:asparaginase [Roseomonas rosulenta]|uniref:asparaginase n=1 Tax=Roseomonas rosulenta TaxID=2748667 RepID=UPI0018DFF56C|nr:asparaginase [Roseomonas rosulenta]
MSFVPMAEIRRGGILESLHHGIAVVADADGRILQSWGDPSFVTFPRSSLKPFQAIPLVESGAADAAGLTEEHLALACASHSAEDFQVALVRGWLERLGLSESALVCGPDLPRSQADQISVIRAGGDRSRVFHNCSGKHCGFLTLTKHIGAPVGGYADPAHPAQRLYLEAFSELLGEDATRLPRGVDGCGLPALALPMAAMARGAARWAAARVATEARRTAIHRLQSAIRTYPDHLSGRGSATGRIVRASQGRVLLKGGAEGYVVGFVPEQGLGIAVKLADGTARAKMGVFSALLGRLGLVDAAESLARDVEGVINDSNGQPVGEVRVTLPD